MGLIARSPNGLSRSFYSIFVGQHTFLGTYGLLFSAATELSTTDFLYDRSDSHYHSDSHHPKATAFPNNDVLPYRERRSDVLYGTERKTGDVVVGRSRTINPDTGFITVVRRVMRYHDC